ncbi:hypothetical protein Oweho_2875 [Owenweeksia hongkongensis DSM 17368]|uniref:Outer membrane protein beta-barrel domain-containing protein n=1 Tax=Owenweeksia hongkongensis (strain DSM 17368 / CIP 108786 / JCM 12287 / NRRL B-23963 / UST20020801) TaxID=926562 RepID=G8R0V6_OWEHD|nr:hypothetical protein [Owenweeksia hongkongensis]AEV33833.1 hypothetical protein Oweho_2875 [Owenweeksia hongkongensis DSM 17368]
MKQRYLLFLSTLLFSSGLFAQTSDSIVYPYVLPIWGQQVQDRGMADQLQLPFGLNVNYVNAFIELEITDFDLSIGGRDFSKIVNLETLNFQEVSATTNGANFRADAWVLPFMNVYGMFSSVTGGTNVTLQPTWKDAVGDVILQLPQFSSNVDFNAVAYGLGTTLIFGWDGYFSSIDLNYSATKTELLEDQVGYLTMSSRGGYRFLLSKKNKDFFIAPYIGIMYRNFTGSKGNNGSISMDEVFPELDQTFNEKVNGKIADNEAIINDPSTTAAERIKLQAQNQALETIEEEVNESGVFSTEIDYFIQKELIQTITFQFGFNLQLNKNWMLRGEYGVADSQRFLMTGVQYRFGVKKKGLR